MAILGLGLTLIIVFAIWLAFLGDGDKKGETAGPNPPPLAQPWGTPDGFLEHVVIALANPIDKASAGASFAAALAKAGKKQQALTAFANAKAVAEEIDDQDHRVNTLRMIAELQSKASFHIEESKTLLRALNIRDGPEQESRKKTPEKNKRKAELASDFARAGKTDKALSLVEVLKVPNDKTNIYIAIADQLIEKKENSSARVVLGHAWHEEKKIPTRGTDRDKAWSKIAISYSRAGYFKPAIEISELLARTSKDQWTLSRTTYRDIIIQMARKGDILAAKAALENNWLPLDDQLRVRCEIASFHAKHNVPKEVRSILKDIWKDTLLESTDLEIFRLIAHEWVELGDNATAVDGLERALSRVYFFKKPSVLSEEQKIRYTLAELYWKENRDEEAEKQLEAIHRQILKTPREQEQCLRLIDSTASMLHAGCTESARYMLKFALDEVDQSKDSKPGNLLHIAKLQAVLVGIKQSLETAKTIPKTEGASALSYIAILHATEKTDHPEFDYRKSRSYHGTRLIRIDRSRMKESFTTEEQKIAKDICDALKKKSSTAPAPATRRRTPGNTK